MHTTPDSDTVQELRTDLAAAFRLTARFGWHESVGNHFSAVASADRRTFLMNPRWVHFAQIRASDLQAFAVDDGDVMSRADAPDPSAWTIHGTLHRERPSIGVLLHCHPPYATALAALKNPVMLPIDQNTARFFGRVSIDRGFGGIADDAAEGRRLAHAFGNHSILLMGNHGIAVTGDTVAEAFEDLYFFERAARTLMLAYASGQPLAIMPDDLAEKTAQDWDKYDGMAHAHFASLKASLDRSDAGYRD